MTIKICIGSSCHLKGSQDIVEFLENAVKQHNLDNKITLAGSFCVGKCNREGVTVQVDDNVFTGLTKENVKEFFENNVLNVIDK